MARADFILRVLAGPEDKENTSKGIMTVSEATSLFILMNGNPP